MDEQESERKRMRLEASNELDASRTSKIIFSITRSIADNGTLSEVEQVKNFLDDLVDESLSFDAICEKYGTTKTARPLDWKIIGELRAKKYEVKTLIGLYPHVSLLLH